MFVLPFPCLSELLQCLSEAFGWPSWELDFQSNISRTQRTPVSDSLSLSLTKKSIVLSIIFVELLMFVMNSLQVVLNLLSLDFSMFDLLFAMFCYVLLRFATCCYVFTMFCYVLLCFCYVLLCFCYVLLCFLLILCLDFCDLRKTSRLQQKYWFRAWSLWILAN